MRHGSKMSLEDHPRAVRWLRQFDSPDVPIARLFLRSLKLISHSEFERSLTELLSRFLGESKPPISIFPIRKPTKKREEGREKRIHFSSADRIGHFVENLERAHPNRIRVSPTINSMRAEKTDLIVLVDDIIGSGTRIFDYWSESVSASVKSWRSYKKCKLIIATYAAHPNGVLRIRNRIRCFRNRDSLIFCQRLPRRVRAWDQSVEDLCKRYGSRTSKPGVALGVGDVMTPIVFQHGCPNNAPVILWSGGRSWEALFPNRSIPSELYGCFGEESGADASEILWRSGQYRLGLKILEAIETGNLESDQIKILSVLGLLLKNVRVDLIPSWLMFNRADFEKIMKKARGSYLIDDAYKVTSFGRDLVERFRRIRTSQDKLVHTNEEAERFYYPQQYKGVQRKSSVISVPCR